MVYVLPRSSVRHTIDIPRSLPSGNKPMSKTYKRRPQRILGIPLWWMLNIYPPFLGAGIRVRREVEDDVPTYVARMKLRSWNRNAVGTHFGGSLFAMTDPFHMLILLESLGPDYIVWDKRSNVRYRKPGRGTVEAIFRVERQQIEDLRQAADTESKIEPVFRIEITDEDGDVVAEVEKRLYIKRKG